MEGTQNDPLSSPATELEVGEDVTDRSIWKSSPISSEKTQAATEDIPEVKTLVTALLVLSQDKEIDISSTAMSTVQELGKKHPSTVLRALHSNFNGKLPTKSAILDVIESTVRQSIELNQLDENLAANLIQLCVNELIGGNQDGPSSAILVQIGAVYCDDVVRSLIPSIPLPSALDCLGLLAVSNVYGAILHLKFILEKLIDLLIGNQVKTNAMKSNFARILAKISESVAFYSANSDRAPTGVSVHPAEFEEDIGRAFQILFGQWLPCKSLSTCRDILDALGHMSPLMAKENIEQVRKISEFLFSLI